MIVLFVPWYLRFDFSIMVGFFGCDITGQKLYSSFFHLCVFVSLLMRPFVHTKCVRLRKKNVICRSNGRVRNCLICLLLLLLLLLLFCIFFFLFYRKAPAQTVWMHPHSLSSSFAIKKKKKKKTKKKKKKTCWSGTVLVICLDAVTYFIWIFFYCKDPKTLIILRRCTYMHMLI